LPRADATIKACRDNNVKIEIAENVWLWPEERLKQKIVREGLVGKPVHARLKYPCGSYHGFNGVRMILGEEAVRVLGYGGEVEVMPLPAYGGGIMNSVKWDGACVEFESGLKLLFEMPPKKPVWERNWDIVGTLGYITGESLVVYDEGHHHGAGTETHFPIETVYTEVGGDRVLQSVRVNTAPAVEWENPYVRYRISSTDDIAKAAILESMYRAVVDGADLLYGAENARRDQELIIAVKESAWRGSQWMHLPLREVTRVEQRLHEVFRDMYACDPLGDIDKQLHARYSRHSAQWVAAGWL
jgi:predicted dehydrogenase